jgi:thiol-disulfide isomerase/thioredoxin
MANPKANAKASTTSSARRTQYIVGAIVAVVFLIIAVVIFAGGNNDDSSTSNTSATTATAAGGSGGTSAGPGENQPVTYTGDVLTPLEDPTNDAARGKVAPTLSGYAFDGSPLALAPTGAPTLVVFLAHWCPHCNAEIPRLIEWKASGKMPADLNIVGVSTAARNDQPNYPPSKWVVDMKWPWAVMADSEAQDAAVAYGVSGYPGLVLLDGEGKVLARRSGEVGVTELDAWAREYLPV